MRIRIFAGAMVLQLAAACGAYGGNSNNVDAGVADASVVGRWGDFPGSCNRPGADVAEFTRDGRVTRGQAATTWRADGDRVTLTADHRERAITVSGDRLTIHGDRMANGEESMGETLHRCPS